MPICIECRSPVHQLYTTYSKADDRSLGKGVRLTQCPRCKKFADKYVEHDYVVLFIDLVLIKPQVYRHLLFNRLGREDDRFDPSIIRLGVLLLLFDVYLTWARIEKAYPQHVLGSGFSPLESSTTSALLSPAVDAMIPNPISHQPLLLQYFFFLLLCSTCTLAFHLPVRLLASHAHTYLPSVLRPLPVPYRRGNRISTALLVSSCSKLFPILMVIWDYDLPSSASAVSWAVIVNNIAALEILLDCGYVRAAVLAAAGALCRATMGWALLRSVGLAGGRSFGELSNLAATWAWLVN